MVKVTFTQNIQRHVACPPCDAPGATIAEVMDHVFSGNEKARKYVLDEHGEVRKHMIIFINGRAIQDRVKLTDAVNEGDTVCVMQALSGG